MFGICFKDYFNRLLAYLESQDGIHWVRPAQVLQDPAPGIQFGASVIDQGPAGSEKYKFAWYYGAVPNGGMHIAVSADGLSWTPISENHLVPFDHDIVHLAYDDIRRRYIASGSTLQYKPFLEVRCPTQSVSADLLNWSAPVPVITPDERDEGATAFYGMSGIVNRGGLLVGLLKVLRDDLVTEGAPMDSFGIGYTTLCWSRDGVTWQRDTQPFLDRDHTVGTWDHAMAWGDSQLVVGDNTFIYYGGYKWGHKVNRFTERQIGLATMGRDRYVSRNAGATAGTLRTPVFTTEADGITINASVEGELRVRILDQNGNSLSGFEWSDFTAIHGDSLSHAAQWTRDFSTLEGIPISLEFSLTDGQLYGFDLIHAPEPGALISTTAAGLCLLGYYWKGKK